MKSVKGQDLVDQLFSMYCFRVERDQDGLIGSLILASIRTLLPEVDQDELEGALCAVFSRSKGKVCNLSYSRAWEKLSPKTWSDFTRCHECKAFGRSRHSINCSFLHSLEDRGLI